MSMKRLARACLTGAALCLAVAPAAAHPPDLPVDTRDECIPQLDTHVQPADAPAAADPARLEHARRMYLIAERCRRAGDLEMARNCYQETRLLCPDSEYAHKAAQRIRRMRGRLAEQDEGAAEEQEQPPALERREKEPAESEVDRKLKLAFGDQCPDVNRSIKLEIRKKGLVFASNEFHIVEDGKVQFTPFRAAFIGEEREGRKGPEIITVQSDSALLTLDRPVESITDFGNHTIIGAELKGNVVVSRKRGAAARGDDSEDASEEQEPAEAPPEGRAALLRETDYGKMVEAKVLYYVGERCRRGGDVDMAYRCYEEAHRACPQCRHGKKALQRMRRIDEDRQTNARAGESREPPLTPRVNEVRIEPVFPMIDPQIVPAFDRLLAQEGQIAGAALDLVEEAPPPAAGAEEAEEDYLPGPCGDTCPDSELLRLFIEPPPRDLVLCPVHGEEAQDSAACEDLSDWLRQTVRLMGGAGSLRIDAARLGRLMSQGEGAVRALGCTVVHECGRAYVVYPARPR